MDLAALEYTRSHYDKHSNQFASTEEALKARAQGPGAPLKKFHNDIKRQLISRFAHGADSLLDFACGRGGDIWKWIDAGIKHVKGIDLSPGEIQEARNRFEEARAKRRDQQLEYEFVDSPQLGVAEWREERQYDVVTCMFAIHYFFVTEQALKQFLHNVSINLKDGGYFVGTVPDGKKINACTLNNKAYHSPMLTIEAQWQGAPQCFGSPYICAIGDTVTGGEKGTQGSLEYLVYSNALAGVAAQYGLKPVLDYGDPKLQSLFDPADARKPLKHFLPNFSRSDPSLERASSLFAAFVFQKTSGTPLAPATSSRVGSVSSGAHQQHPQAAGLRAAAVAAAAATAAGTKRGREEGQQAAAAAGQRPVQRRRPGLLKAPAQQEQREQQLEAHEEPAGQQETVEQERRQQDNEEEDDDEEEEVEQESQEWWRMIAQRHRPDEDSFAGACDCEPEACLHRF